MKLFCCVRQSSRTAPSVLEVLACGPPESPPFFRRATVDFNIDSAHNVVSKPFVALLHCDGEVELFPPNDKRQKVKIGGKDLTINGKIELVWIKEGELEKHSSTFLVAAGEEVYFDLLVGHQTIAEFELPGHDEIRKRRARMGKMKFWGRGRSDKNLQ